jgi:hypothetical protein
MLQQVGAMLKKPFAPFLEQSGTDMVRPAACLMLIGGYRLQSGVYAQPGSCTACAMNSSCYVSYMFR